jgi:hypothetical protein
VHASSGCTRSASNKLHEFRICVLALLLQVLTAPTSSDAEIKALRSDIELMHKQHTEEPAVVKQRLAQLDFYLLPKREAAAAEQRSMHEVAEAPDTWHEHSHQYAPVDQASVLARDEVLDAVFSSLALAITTT